MKIIKELELEKNVTLLGFITKEAYLKTLKSADIFVLTSIFEGMPLAILEAMSVGLPVIANDCESGPREILDNGKFGKLIEFNKGKTTIGGGGLIKNLTLLNKNNKLKIQKTSNVKNNLKKLSKLKIN